MTRIAIDCALLESVEAFWRLEPLGMGLSIFERLRRTFLVRPLCSMSSRSPMSADSAEGKRLVAMELQDPERVNEFEHWVPYLVVHPT